ncbi:MAG: RloB family protein [Candidatus Symbiobacter sp.]|nr:RloB family protein [Candidatus Symbiobacter sp.]
MNATSTERQQRRRGIKKILPQILIVCEGEDTEYNYFDHIIDAHKLNNAVTIKHSEGKTSATQIVHKALKVYLNNNRNFQEIYIVMDRDRKHDFGKIIAKLELCDIKGVNIRTIISFPSIEIWFLLHFYDETHQVFLSATHPRKYKSPNDLKPLLGDKYNQENLNDRNERYNLLLERFSTAQDRAVNLRESNYNLLRYEQKIFTNVDELVGKLISLCRQQR